MCKRIAWPKRFCRKDWGLGPWGDVPPGPSGWAYFWLLSPENHRRRQTVGQRHSVRGKRDEAKGEVGENERTPQVITGFEGRQWGRQPRSGDRQLLDAESCSANSVWGQQDPSPISRENQILPTHQMALEVNSPWESLEKNSALPTTWFWFVNTGQRNLSALLDFWPTEV